MICYCECDLTIVYCLDHCTFQYKNSEFTGILNLFEAIEPCVIDLHHNTFSNPVFLFSTHISGYELEHNVLQQQLLFMGRMRSQYIQQLLTRTLLSHLVEISGCFEVKVHIGGAKASAGHFEVDTVQLWEVQFLLQLSTLHKEDSYIIKQTADELLVWGFLGMESSLYWTISALTTACCCSCSCLDSRMPRRSAEIFCRQRLTPSPVLAETAYVRRLCSCANLWCRSDLMARRCSRSILLATRA